MKIQEICKFEQILSDSWTNLATNYCFSSHKQRKLIQSGTQLPISALQRDDSGIHSVIWRDIRTEWNALLKQKFAYNAT